jgi:hypothetical protein
LDLLFGLASRRVHTRLAPGYESGVWVNHELPQGRNAIEIVVLALRSAGHEDGVPRLDAGELDVVLCLVRRRRRVLATRGRPDALRLVALRRVADGREGDVVARVLDLRREVGLRQRLVEAPLERRADVMKMAVASRVLEGVEAVACARSKLG